VAAPGSAARLQGLLEKHHPGWQFREWQLQALLAAEAGRDVFATAPTSAGKSLVIEYLPWVLSPHAATTIVIIPLVALGEELCANLNAPWKREKPPASASTLVAAVASAHIRASDTAPSVSGTGVHRPETGSVYLLYN
jgi:Lhr-like helicase